MRPDNTIELPEPWHWTDLDLTDQLKKEIRIDHILYNKSVKTIARRQDNDDVLFELADNKFAVVHLTWQQSTSTHKDFPSTIIYNNWQEVFDRIIVDKADFE